jgi:hypothetical protein
MAEIVGTVSAAPPPSPLAKPGTVLGGNPGIETPVVHAAGADEGEASGSKASRDDLEDRFEWLDLCGEEETGLDFSEEIDDLIGEIRWLAIFRVHTSKPFSHAALFKQIAMHG